MDKTTAAIDGLAKLIMAGKIDEDIKLFRVYRTAQRSGIHHVLRLLNNLFGKTLKKALSTGHLPVFFMMYTNTCVCAVIL